jgi:Flp pilus assembly pilin Flp
MTKFLKTEEGSASIQYSMLLAFVAMMMLGGLTTLHNNLPTGINKLNAAFVQH